MRAAQRRPCPFPARVLRPGEKDPWPDAVPRTQGTPFSGAGNPPCRESHRTVRQDGHVRPADFHLVQRTPVRRDSTPEERLTGAADFQQQDVLHPGTAGQGLRRSLLQHGRRDEQDPPSGRGPRGRTPDGALAGQQLRPGRLRDEASCHLRQFGPAPGHEEPHERRQGARVEADQETDSLRPGRHADPAQAAPGRGEQGRARHPGRPLRDHHGRRRRLQEDIQPDGRLPYHDHRQLRDGGEPHGGRAVHHRARRQGARGPEVLREGMLAAEKGIWLHFLQGRVSRVPWFRDGHLRPPRDES